MSEVMIITGASSGVGRAASLRFAGEGYTVCALARSVDKLERLAASGHGRIHMYPTDVSDGGQVERVFAKILEEEIGMELHISEEPQLLPALGAALIARENM